MARLIDIQTVIEEIQSLLDIPSYSHYDMGFDDGLKHVLDLIEKAPTLTPPNEPLTLNELREMDGEPVWVEDVKHWALIDIEKGGQWDGVPFAIWAENGMKFTYNIKNRGLHCYRRPPEEEEDT